MPTKFKRSHKTYTKDKGQVTIHSYIKNISVAELVEYINNDNGKPKIKAKVRKELQRRGIKLISKTV